MVKVALQRKLEAAALEGEAKAQALRDAREKNVHFSARVSAPTLEELSFHQSQLYWIVDTLSCKS